MIGFSSTLKSVFNVQLSISVLFCNKLILKTTVKVQVHPLNPPTLLGATSGATCFGELQGKKSDEASNVYD